MNQEANGERNLLTKDTNIIPQKADNKVLTFFEEKRKNAVVVNSEGYVEILANFLEHQMQITKEPGSSRMGQLYSPICFCQEFMKYSLLN